MPKTGIGAILARMIPSSIAFLFCWTLMLTGWILVGLPMGPGAGLHFAK